MNLTERTVFAVIVTFNGEKWIEQCISSLITSTICPKVIVIDNGSKDGTLSIVRNKFHLVQIIELQFNQGFGQANNRGIKIALDNNADFILLLNQDAWVQTDTISTLIGLAKKYPEYGIISPLHLKPDSRQLEFNFSTFVGRTNKRQDILSDAFFQELKEIYELDYINAACWLVTRECIETVGGFDPLFFHYVEDDDYCKRVNYSGLKIGFTSKTEIFHAVDNYKPVFTSKWQEVFSNSPRSSGYAILELKHGQGKLLILYINLLSILLGEAFRDLTARNFFGFCFRFSLMYKLTLLLPKIRRSRLLSHNFGPAFLQASVKSL